MHEHHVAVVSNQIVVWLADSNNCVVLDMDNATANHGQCPGGVVCSATITLPGPTGITINEEEVMCLRCSEEGYLLYLAVGSPTEDMAELFKLVPGGEMSDRRRRRWRRQLLRDVRVFESLTGCYNVAEFVNLVQFPLQVVEVEEIHH